MVVLKLSHIRFAVPESMSGKDLQSLVGFLATLRIVDSEYCYGGNSIDYAHHLGEYSSVQLEELVIMDKAEAKALAKVGREAYEQRKQAEAQSA
jgi:hypothetical protein